jgi:hypothetical protein
MPDPLILDTNAMSTEPTGGLPTKSAELEHWAPLVIAEQHREQPADASEDCTVINNAAGQGQGCEAEWTFSDGGLKAWSVIFVRLLNSAFREFNLTVFSTPLVCTHVGVLVVGLQRARVCDPSPISRISPRALLISHLLLLPLVWVFIALNCTG